MKPIGRCMLGVICLLIAVIPALGQAPAAPTKVYSGSFGAGLAITGGNSDTKNVNVTFDMVRDPKTKNLIKINAFYLRSSAQSVRTAEQLAFGFRDDFSISKNVFAYGALPYLRDPFKNISYLLNPQGGIGFKLLASARNTLNLSAGAGAVWEKDSGVNVQSSGTLNAGQSYQLKLSDTTSINQVFSGLWKTDDFNDALYHFGVAMATSITKLVQVKVEFRDDFKNVTPDPTIKRNDTAFVTSFLFKF